MYASKTFILKVFASTTKVDVVCIGSVAEKVSRMAEKQNAQLQTSKLIFQSGAKKYEPSLLSIGQSEIQVDQNNQNASVLLRNQIHNIQPQSSTVQLKNGNLVKYRHLIYSGDDSEWKDTTYTKGLNKALRVKQSSVFADIPHSNLENLYGQQHGDIFFYVPKGFHFGYENYFALHLMETLKNKKANGTFEALKTKITILNEGQQLIPGNKEIDSSLKQLLIEGGVEIVNHFSIDKIDNKRRAIVSRQNKTLKFGSLYHYLPRKAPQILKAAGIDPFDVNLQTLKNNKYQNISVVGNILPFVFSYYSLNYMAHVYARNIVNQFLRSGKEAIYRGDTVVPFWAGSDHLMYFAMNYNSTKYFNNLGESKALGKLLSWDKKLFGKKEVSSYLNGSSYGLPFYIIRPWAEEISRTVQETPMLVQKEEA